MFERILCNYPSFTAHKEQNKPLVGYQFVYQFAKPSGNPACPIREEENPGCPRTNPSTWKSFCKPGKLGRFSSPVTMVGPNARRGSRLPHPGKGYPTATSGERIFDVHHRGEEITLRGSYISCILNVVECILHIWVRVRSRHHSY